MISIWAKDPPIPTSTAASGSSSSKPARADISANPGQTAQGIHCILIAKDLERVADHATNIAEDVILVTEGGSESLSGHLPATPDAIEALMQGA